MAYEAPVGSGLLSQSESKQNSNTTQKKVPTLEKTTAVGYDASTSDQIFRVSAAADSATREPIPKEVEVENSGNSPVFVMTGYETYSDDTSDGVTEFLHTMLMPGEKFNPPVRAIIRTGESIAIMDGTAVDNAAPDSNEYVDSTADTDDVTADDNVDNSASNTTVYLEPYTSSADCTANLFRVGDLIRIRDEVMEVTAIGSKADLANNKLTVKRAMYGSDATANTDDEDPVRLPFFNAYHDFDKYSVAQTDSQGRFKAFNFFGLGRAATEVQGLIPGSVALRFYQAGYQSLGLSDITPSTHSGLTASTTYYFTIGVDGGLTEQVSFTTDSSNLNFGGTNGIINKIQSALDTQYYTSGNLFEKKVKVALIDGDVRFTSGQHLSTSAIALTAGTSGSGASVRFFAQANGRIPALANINAAVAARLPDDVIYDRITYTTSPNLDLLLYDDGQGNLMGSGSGVINYETGALDFTNAPPNAEFVISCLHTSVFAGKATEATSDRINTLQTISVNSPSQKTSGEVKLRTY